MRNTNFRNTDDGNISQSKKKRLKKYDGTQTKKKSLFVGGGGPFKVRSGKSKKWKINPMRYAVKNPLKKSTKSWVNPRRYLAYAKTKKKRELRGQRRDESHVQKKLYDYQRLKDSVYLYQKAKEDLKQAKVNGLSKDEIKALRQEMKKAKALMYKAGNVQTHMSSNKILKIAESGIAKYEEKQKYYVASTDKLKGEAIDFIKNRTEYLKNGKPELTKKLDSLATSDHTKMAFIKISDRDPIPVNKLKYSDFNIDNPRVTNAYLDQFKTVNDSITKINKDFNITRLSPERRVELAHELHKITVEGIHDPVAQEHHFLKAVTDIAYKDKYYSALNSKSKGASFEYLKAQGPYTQPVDTPEPNLRQKKTMLEQKLRKAELPEYALTEAEKRNIRTEIDYLDKELKQSPDTIDKQIREQEKLMTGISKLDPTYEEQRMKLDRLKEHRANIETVQKADFASDTTIIANEITRLNEARELLLKKGGKINTSIGVNVLSGELNKIKQNLEDNPPETQQQRNLLEKRKNRLESVIQRQNEFKQIQDTITTLESMTPEAREKFKNDLQFKSGDELQALLAEKQRIKQLISDSPQLQAVIHKDIAQIEAAIKVQGFKKQINTANIPGVMKERIKQDITTDMTQNNVTALTNKILNDKELNFRLAKQLADKKATNAAQKRSEIKGKLIDAQTKRKAELNRIWKRVGAKFVRAPENIQVLRRQLKADTNYSEKVAQQAAKISKAVEAGKITPEKAAQLLKQFETKHIGYIPEDSLKLLRVVANNSQLTKKPVRSGAIGRNPVVKPIEPVVEPVEPVVEPVEPVKPVVEPKGHQGVNPLTGKSGSASVVPSAKNLQDARKKLRPAPPNVKVAPNPNTA
jgi:hypothetical protein